MNTILVRGQGANLKANTPNLKQLLVGLGWNTVKMTGEPELDIDVSVICTDEDGKSNTILSYCNPEEKSGAITFYGDDFLAGDKERILILLDNVPNNIKRLTITLHIYEPSCRSQHFGKVKSCFVRAVDFETRKELLRYEATDSYDDMTSIIIADIYRYKGEWKFKARGEGMKVEELRNTIWQ